MGIILAKLKADGRLFQVAEDRGRDGESTRDASSPLDQEKIYWGHLLKDLTVGGPQPLEFSGAESATFRGDQLEELHGDFGVVKY